MALQFLIPIALAAAGASYNATKERQNRENMAKAAADSQLNTLNKIKEKSAESQKAYLDALPQFTPESQQERLQEIAAQNAENIKPQVQEGAPDYQLSDNTPGVVSNLFKDTIIGEQKRTNQQAERLARLRSYGDANFANGVGANRAGQLINEIGGQARGINNLAAINRDAAAERAYRDPGMFGDILQMAGMMYGMGGGAGGATAAPTFAGGPSASWGAMYSGGY